MLKHWIASARRKRAGWPVPTCYSGLGSDPQNILLQTVIQLMKFRIMKIGENQVEKRNKLTDAVPTIAQFQFLVVEKLPNNKIENEWHSQREKSKSK